MLCSLMLVVYVSNLDEYVQSTINKFADKTKVCGIIFNEGGYQNYSKTFNIWATGLRNGYNVLMQISARCKSNQGQTFTVNGRPLASVVNAFTVHCIIF